MTPLWNEKATRLGFVVGCGLTLFFLPAMSGCSRTGGSGTTDSIASEKNRHILQMASLYRTYRDTHNGKPAATVEVLKEWAQKQPKDQLEKIIHDPLDEVFISPRDQEPYGIVPPPTGRRMGPQGVVVYETKGAGGKHLVATDTGNINAYDETTFKQAIPGVK